MQFRRTMIFTVGLLFLFAGTASLFMADRAGAEVVRPIPNKRAKVLDLRTSDVGDPDTVWIGHVQTPTGLPGTPGGFGPYKIGRGTRLHNGIASDFPNGVWTFDDFQGGTDVDSLQGWWPAALTYGSVGASNQNDKNRPFYGFDYGNQGNYVIPQGNPKRTYGVTGYWHRDGGVNQPAVPFDASQHNPANVTWTPLGGSNSAWCGLRSHGDISAQDATANGGTGNYHNQGVLEYIGNNTTVQFGAASPNGTDKNFPGYGSQWDQMLYRDVALANGASLSISFKYRTDMSEDKNTASNTRVGWFDKDPIKRAVANDANFISSSDAGDSAPVDSFMVYIGVPVEPVAGEDNDFRSTDPTAGANGDGFFEIYDVKRRWFSEVIAINQPYRELLSESGVNASSTFSTTVPNAVIQPILDAQPGLGGNVRIVFRVKTNRGFDDEDNYVSEFSSGTAGAAIVDDVVVNATTIGDFEAANSINNGSGVAALTAWKSTGKPPQAFFHSLELAGQPFADPCGVIASARQCNMEGRVVHGGDADRQEAPGGTFGLSNSQDRQHWLASPTINMKSNGPGDYNGMGIDSEIADAEGDIWVDFDVFAGVFQFAVAGTANGIRVGWQSYPATQPNGVKCWGEIVKTSSFSSYDGTIGCFALSDFTSTFAPAGAVAKSSGLIVTSNANGIPDSLRAYIEHLTICYRRPVTAATCSPSSGPFAGGYIDNISIGFIDSPTPPQIAVEIWDLFNDSFPANDAIAPGSPAFDTTAALVKTGFNLANQTGDLTRHNVPSDSALVFSPAPNLRMDLVFRILPGVGNYRQVGNRASGLRKRPDQGGLAGNAVAPGDGSFWGEYLANNGTFGTAGGHGGTWNPNVWNSARMDTCENNFFPTEGVVPNNEPLGPNLATGFYATQYHESDPKFTTLGVIKNRCFLQNNASGSSINYDNLNCGNGVFGDPGAPWPPAWVSLAGSGLNPNEVLGQPGRTREYTKILPDGQLTPGAHVQYFFRRSLLSNPADFDMLPETTYVIQRSEGPNGDGHRWQQFGILPDRWKDPAFGGQAMACMLVVDVGDRRGDELIWVSLADSIGLTAAARYGAHSGWKARPDQTFVTPAGEPINIVGTTMQVAAHGGQPGTLWDFFQVKAGESNVPSGRLGSRSASQVNPGFAQGKFSKHGPTQNMLLTYYRTLIWLYADLSIQGMGPLDDQTDDDVGALTSFITNSTIGTVPRGLIMTGRDLVESQDTDHPGFFANFFGASLRDPDYRGSFGNSNNVADLIVSPPLASSPRIYAMFNSCLNRYDVLNVETGLTGAIAAAHYENVGAGGPFVAAVYAPEGTRNARTLVTGWDYLDTGSRYTLTTGGHKALWFDLLTGIFAGLCAPSGSPLGIGDGPAPFASFLNLRSANPMRSGEAQIAFGIKSTERVEVKVYDVTGRLVKTVANRTFAGGVEHVVTWDGTNDEGQSVARGVYFYQLRSPSFTSQKKLTVLKN